MTALPSDQTTRAVELASAGATRPLIGVEEAARGAEVTARTIRRWVDLGRLVNYGTSRRLLLDRDELEAWTPTHRAMRRLRDCLRDVR